MISIFLTTQVPARAAETCSEAGSETNPLCATDAMVRWANDAVPSLGRSPTARLRLLYDAMVSPQGLALREDTSMTSTAREAFTHRRANCVSFALLFVSLARSLDLPTGFARFDDIEGYEQRGDLRVATTHLTAYVRHGKRAFVIDFGGVSAAPENARQTSDAEAIAIYHANRGGEWLSAGRTPEAIAALDQAISLAPHLGAAWVNLGVALGRAGRGNDAVVAYRRAIALEPESLPAWRNLAILLLREAKPE